MTARSTGDRFSAWLRRELRREEAAGLTTLRDMTAAERAALRKAYIAGHAAGSQDQKRRYRDQAVRPVHLDRHRDRRLD